jgi:hypothetical protein
LKGGEVLRGGETPSLLHSPLQPEKYHIKKCYGLERGLRGEAYVCLTVNI